MSTEKKEKAKALRMFATWMVVVFFLGAAMAAGAKTVEWLWPTDMPTEMTVIHEWAEEPTEELP